MVSLQNTAFSELPFFPLSTPGSRSRSPVIPSRQLSMVAQRANRGMSIIASVQQWWSTSRVELDKNLDILVCQNILDLTDTANQTVVDYHIELLDTIWCEKEILNYEFELIISDISTYFKNTTKPRMEKRVAQVQVLQ